MKSVEYLSRVGCLSENGGFHISGHPTPLPESPTPLLPAYWKNIDGNTYTSIPNRTFGSAEWVLTPTPEQQERAEFAAYCSVKNREDDQSCADFVAMLYKDFLKTRKPDAGL